MRHFLFILLFITLFPFASWANNNELLTPSEFHLAQMKYQYKQLNDLADMISGKILEQYQIDEKMTYDFTKSLLNYIQGSFLPESFQCGSKTTINAIKPVNDWESRLALLEQVGPDLIWVAMEFASYQHILQSEVDKPLVPAICERLTQIAKAMRCVANAPNSCKTATLRKNIQAVPFQLAGNKKPILLVNQQLVPIKSAIHPFLSSIITELNQSESTLRMAVEKKINAPSATVDELLSEIKNSIKHSALRQTAYVLYQQYQKLPEDIRNNIETGSLKQSAMDAQAAFKSLNSTDKNIKALSLQAQYTAKVKIKKFVTKIRPEFKPPEEIKKIDDELEKLLAQPTKELCDKLKTEKQTSQNWGPDRFGVQPTKQNPLGYRFVVKPAGESIYINNTKVPEYGVRLELLTYIPAGEYIAKPFKKATGEEFKCKNLESDSFAVIDTGLVISKTYRSMFTKDDFAKGYRNLIKENRLRYTASFSKALLKLGLPGGWLKAEPDCSVSDDFINLTCAMPAPGGDLPIDIIANGKMVMEPRKVGLSLCQRIEDHILPELAQDWSDTVQLPMKGWSLNLNQSSAIELQSCKDYFNPKNGKDLVPLSDNELIATVSVNVQGELGENSFIWPASATIVTSPNHVKMKTVIFGQTPKVVEEYIDNIFGKTRQQWSLTGPSDLEFVVRTGALAQTNNFQSFMFPIALEVSSETCAASSVNTSFDLTKGSFEMDSDQLESVFKGLVACKAKRKISEIIANNTPKCESIDADLFGLVKLKHSANEPLENNRGCRLTMEGSMGDHTVTIDNILALRDAQQIFKLDFSKVKVNSSFEQQLRTQIKGALGSIADTGLTISNIRFSKRALLFNAVIDKEEPIGRIDLGTVTLSQDDHLSLEAELKHIIESRVKSLLEPKLEALALSHLPDNVSDLKVNLGYQNKQISAFAKFKVAVHENLPLIPADIKLLPNLKVDIKLDEDFLKAQAKAKLEGYLNNIIPLKAGPVAIDPPTYAQTLSLDITLITGVEIDLDSLGEIKVKKIYINRKGVDFRGRAEFRVNASLVLFPAPVPVLLTRPGIFYDFENQEVGALGALTMVAPAFDRIFQIDAHLGIGDPNEFISKLELKGELILLDTVPVVYTSGNLDFKRLSARFDAHTSEIFAKVLSAKVNGNFSSAESRINLDSMLKVLGVELSKTELKVFLDKCPKRCISGSASIDFLLGKGKATVNTSPLLVDAMVEMDIDLTILGKKLGGAEIQAEILRAHLEAVVLGFLELSITTPGLKQLTPQYIADIIASLLQIDLKMLKEWLENPKFELKPAGSGSSSTTSSSKGDNSSDGRSSSDGQGTSNQEGPKPGTVSPTENFEKKTGSAPSPFPEGIVVPSQRRTEQNGNSFSACRNQNGDRSKGVITYHKNWGRGWYYHPHYRNLSERTFKKICERDNAVSQSAWQHTGAFAINDDFIPLQSHAQITGKSYKRECTPSDKTRQCETTFYNYGINYFTPSDPKVRPRDLQVYPREYSYEHVTSGKTYEVDITVTENELESLLKEWKQIKNDKILNKRLKWMVYIQTDKVVDSIKDIEDGTGMFSWFTDPKLTVHYAIAKSSKVFNSSKRVIIWVNKAANQAVFSQSCQQWYWWYRPYKNSHTPNCIVKESDDLDNQTLQALRNAKIRMVSGEEVILDLNQTSWLFNDAIPSLLDESNNIPKPGIPVAFDKEVGQCNIQQLTMQDHPDELSFRIFESISGTNSKGEAITGQQLKTFSVTKNMSHEVWTDSNNKKFIDLMASYLACKDDPSTWINQHRLWLDPLDTHQDVTFLYYDIHQRSRDYAYITEVRNNQKPRNFYVQKKDPYPTLLNRSPIRFKQESKKALYELIRKYFANRATLLISQAEHWEAVILQVKNNNTDKHYFFSREINCDKKMDYYLCHKRSGDPNKGLPLVKPVRLEIFLSDSVLKRCVDEISLNNIVRTALDNQKNTDDPTGILSFLRLESPVIETGLGALRVLKMLSKNNEASCRL